MVITNKEHRTLDTFRIAFDAIFITLAVISFYSNLIILCLALMLFFIFVFKTKWYNKDLNGFYLDTFIDFLNQVNSNLSTGMGFERAIISLSKMLEKDQSYSSLAIHKLDNTIRLGVHDEMLYNQVTHFFPIHEAELYSRMIQLSKSTGASASLITSITIDKLYMKYKVNSEIEMILYQKKLEQMILCLAPMIIILFIKVSSPGYMDILYTTLIGRVIMTFALMLILIMKTLSEKLVQFEI